MGNITKKDIDFMHNISNIIDGNFGNSLATHNTNSHNRPNMNNIGFVPDSAGMYMDNMKKFMQIVNESCEDGGIPMKGSSHYDVIVEVDDSNTKIYKVRNENKNVFNNKIFLVCESAIAVAKLLNSGMDSFSEKHIENFVSLDEEFKNYKEKAIYEKHNYMRAKTLNENKAADIFESNFKNYHGKANSTFEQIKDLYSIVMK